MRNEFLKAEQAGKDSFANGTIASYKLAEKFARKAYSSTLERDCFVSGWNVAFWDEQSRVLRASK